MCRPFYRATTCGEEVIEGMEGAVSKGGVGAVLRELERRPKQLSQFRQPGVPASATPCGPSPDQNSRPAARGGQLDDRGGVPPRAAPPADRAHGHTLHPLHAPPPAPTAERTRHSPPPGRLSARCDGCPIT